MNRISQFTIAAVALLGASSAFAQAITIGNSGVETANGVVTAPPAFGPQYRYVSTFGGVSGAGQIAGVGGTNGSSYTTDVFSANAGSVLSFYFNFVTADGTSEFADYAWSALLDNTGASVVDYIFSARTTTSGDTVPGFGLPGLTAVLSPTSTPIIGAPAVWAPLGTSSGSCFGGVGAGCGYTGWVQATYTIANAGNYRLGFGATNFGDAVVDTGLAFTSSTVDGEVIDPTPAIPEPSSWVMLIAGFGLVGAAARRRRTVVAA
jgi:hypothetical protein